MPAHPPNSLIEDARASAAHYASSLEPVRRKRLGQFFTGLPLSRLLAAIALEPGAATVIDPMAGHGDLLDAVAERAWELGSRFDRLQGVEIDSLTSEICRQRLETWRHLAATVRMYSGDAFAPGAAAEYLAEGYDLVLTNPPYVRYQTIATPDGATTQLGTDQIRHRLKGIVRGRVATDEWSIWRNLIENYSGFADLSVPAWILCAALVRPGGVLALVAPATWRSRDYGDVIEYLLARCFRLEYLIEDTQPGWFSDALIRTQLVVARRLEIAETRVPLSERAENNAVVVTAKVSPVASKSGSLVGEAFPGEDSEGAFASWLSQSRRGKQPERVGLVAQVEPLIDVTQSMMASGRRRSWFRNLEPSVFAGALFENSPVSTLSIVPPVLRALFEGHPPLNVVPPESAGLSISQWLRTGCNGFFYVERISETADSLVRIRLSQIFDGDELMIPAACLMPVLRRQAEVVGPIEAAQLGGRVLDLNGWVLPEDAEIVRRAKHLYEREGLQIPRVMPTELASFIRRAAEKVHTSGQGEKRICELSAVKTNARSAGKDRPPRFWYMLPAFAKRHRPDAFVPRVNQRIPWVEMNDDPPVLIDANFSTIWAESSSNWTRFSFRVLLNSSWVRASMEALGTPLGGGALKLEATQLKRLPTPALGAAELAMLDSEGRALAREATSVSETVDRFVIATITGLDKADPKIGELLNGLQLVADTLCRDRQSKGA